MWDRVKVKSKPTEFPISLAELKHRTRVDFDADDTLITSLLNGAVARIDGPAGIGFAMMEQTWTLSLDRFPSVIYLPGAPVKSIASIKYYDSENTLQTVDTADYRLDLGGDQARIEPVVSWPGTYSRFGAVTIEYVLGEASKNDVPADLIDAICLLVAHRYEMRQPIVTGTIVTEVPMAFDSIVAEYRRPAFS